MSATRTLGAYGFGCFGRGNEGAVTLRLSKRLAEVAEPLDPAADAVQGAVKTVPQPVRDVLDGVWLGAPLHPALTDVPLGAWTAAALLDTVGSESADAALAVGVLAAVPAALTGLNDWSYLKEEPKRLGLVHAPLNTMGLTLNVGSLVLRRNGKMVEVDSRPSDAIALAVQMKAPIYVNESVLDEVTPNSGLGGLGGTMDAGPEEEGESEDKE